MRLGIIITTKEWLNHQVTSIAPAFQYHMTKDLSPGGQLHDPALVVIVTAPAGALDFCYQAYHRSFRETPAVGVFLFTIEGKEVTRRGQTI